MEEETREDGKGQERKRRGDERGEGGFRGKERARIGCSKREKGEKEEMMVGREKEEAGKKGGRKGDGKMEGKSRIRLEVEEGKDKGWQRKRQGKRK